MMRSQLRKQGAPPALRDVLRRVQWRHRPEAKPGETMTAEQALIHIRQVIEDAQPGEFHADTKEECEAWVKGINEYHANLLRAFQVEDDFEPISAEWEMEFE